MGEFAHEHAFGAEAHACRGNALEIVFVDGCGKFHTVHGDDHPVVPLFGDFVQYEGRREDLSEKIVIVGFHAARHEKAFDYRQDVSLADALDGAAEAEHFFAGKAPDGFEVALFLGFVELFFEIAAAVRGGFFAVTDRKKNGAFSEEGGEHDALERGAPERKILLVADDVGHVFDVKDEGEAETVVFAHAGKAVARGSLLVAQGSSGGDVRGTQVGKIVFRDETALFADLADDGNSCVSVYVLFGNREVRLPVKGNHTHAAGVFKDPVDECFFLISVFDRIKADRT